MANIRAWIVPVWTARLGGGEPMLVCYIAGFNDHHDAVEAVRKHIGVDDGDEIRDPSAVSNGTAEVLGVKPGEVWML
jgi:hypothetical protein